MIELADAEIIDMNDGPIKYKDILYYPITQFNPDWICNRCGDSLCGEIVWGGRQNNPNRLDHERPKEQRDNKDDKIGNEVICNACIEHISFQEVDLDDMPIPD